MMLALALTLATMPLAPLTHQVYKSCPVSGVSSELVKDKKNPICEKPRDNEVLKVLKSLGVVG